MASAIELFTAFAVQLFIIVDPVVGVPVFLAITPHNTAAERRPMARRGCIAAFLVVAFFIVIGPLLLGYFGIQTASVRICGGVLLFIIALEMLYGRPTGTGTSRREERLAEAKEDISITPLAVPLLAGPGAIATALIFADRAAAPLDWLALLAAAAVVFAVTLLFLWRADDLVRWVGSLGTAILTRIMGLLLAFLAVQYAVDGFRSIL
ncbi:MAG TPA: MarC family protein [Desulfuromonadales bacterium]|jgi:multiple antibiotic resistance protein